MTKEEIKAVLERVLTWPPQQQEAAADMLLVLEGQKAEVYEPSDEEWAAIQEGFGEVERGEFASEDELAAVWKRHGL